jgi:hypothetical protein
MNVRESVTSDAANQEQRQIRCWREFMKQSTKDEIKGKAHEVNRYS